MKTPTALMLLLLLAPAVHQAGSYPTVYSYLFDLSRMTITVFHDHDYAANRVYSLDGLVQRNASIGIDF